MEANDVESHGTTGCHIETELGMEAKDVERHGTSGCHFETEVVMEGNDGTHCHGCRHL